MSHEPDGWDDGKSAAITEQGATIAALSVELAETKAALTQGGCQCERGCGDHCWCRCHKLETEIENLKRLSGPNWKNLCEQAEATCDALKAALERAEAHKREFVAGWDHQYQAVCKEAAELRAALATAQERADYFEKAYEGVCRIEKSVGERIGEANARADMQAQVAKDLSADVADLVTRLTEANARAQSARREALEDAAQVCDTWAGYYPPGMFLEPVIIYGEPITQTFVTRLSASFGRHVSNTIANEIRALLTPNKAPEESK